MKNKDFCVFILTHGRPKSVHTYKTLKKLGYTGKIYIVIDNEDKTENEYKKTFGDQVIVFDKKAIAETTDQGDNFNDRRTTTHVRNALFNIAKDLGIKYFMQLDDDYTAFNYKYEDKFNYIEKKVKNLDNVFDILLDFYKTIDAKSIAMAQGGDFIGGKNSALAKKPKLKRKCMNSFICSTDIPFKFISRLNEDVNTYMTLGTKGDLFFTVPNLELKQKATQSNSGGMTETYLDNGTYVKSFYTVMYCPSFAKVTEMGAKQKRLHHKINWKNAVPVILNEKFRKV